MLIWIMEVSTDTYRIIEMINMNDEASRPL